jgi:4-amino-4-deoxy-L-arabinose transferase-like glycosyltransferase
VTRAASRQASAAWWPLVVVLCCAPLFVGLGRADITGDEAIYSFAVDRMLETGNWLVPMSSPNETYAFLEKPPLKFWIVGLPIRAGILPHDEFGMRFWDALFGSISFLYVFALGRRLAGPVAGGVATLTLFAHAPLIFDHGLRGNNMEAALLLCYCGGMYHFVAWSTAASIGPARRWHAAAVGLYFVLGFMTKFVAAAFLPFVILCAGLLVRAYRARLRRDWRLWSGVSLMVVALCAPWFVYAYEQFGSFLWTVMFGEHIVHRFTGALDPAHLHPWYYYLASIDMALGGSDAFLLVAVGMIALTAGVLRRQAPPEHSLLLLWLAIPLTLMSAGSSKLYHYAFPFLPPLALAAGLAAVLLLERLPPVVRRLLAQLDAGAPGHWRIAATIERRPIVRAAFGVLAAIAFAIAAWSVVAGSIELSLPVGAVFKSHGVLRPLVAAIVCAALATRGRMPVSVVAVLFVVSLLPLPGYREIISRLGMGTRVMADASGCLQGMERDVAPSSPHGMYIDAPDEGIQHGMNYYFRRLRPWTRAPQPSPDRLANVIDLPSEQQPALVWRPTYEQYLETRSSTDAAADDAHLAVVPMPDDMVLVLPGPYAACAPQADRPARRG